MKTINYIFILTTIISSCGYTKPVLVPFSVETTPAEPDYANHSNWAALPFVKDSADHIPAPGIADRQKYAAIDVFYIHPTSYFSRRHWNAPVDLLKMVEHTDKGTMTHQASVFNGTCKIYAPRYRQVTYQAFFSLENPDAEKAFDVAYSDVKKAFEYYLTYYNMGRPFIIAGHSQGTIMAKWLLRDYIDGKTIQENLVAAYLIGMPVYRQDLKYIPPCDQPGQTGCYISWRTYQEGHFPKPEYQIAYPEQVVVVNPLSFTRDSSLITSNYNWGGLGRNALTIHPQVCSAQIQKDIIWASKPEIPGKFLLITKNYHRAEVNLYWLNIRQNLASQVENFFE